MKALLALISMMRVRARRLSVRASLFSIALVQIGGCVSPTAILISYEIEVKVAKTTSASAATDQAQGKTEMSITRPTSGESFQGTTFRDSLLEAKVTAVRGGFEMALTNLGRGETCFRFDEGQLSSNFRAIPLPLSGFAPLDWIKLPEVTDKNREKIVEAGPQPIDKACIAPGELRRVVCYLQTKDFFPSGMMFNVDHPKDVAKLQPNGIDNWLTLQLPVEVGGQRSVYEFKMTAIASRARPTYY